MDKIILPGLIDPHVHLRNPGQTHKEDFYTGTAAAIAGGYTTIIDMPNNKTPITTLKKLEEKISIAKNKILCDVGFYFGSLGDNFDQFIKVKHKVIGLKLYLNETTGNFLINKKSLEKIFTAWLHTSALHSNKLWNQKPILLHAEDKTVDYVIKVVEKTRQHAHFCHISTAYELNQIIKAKEKGIPLTCGVTPHHLFLTKYDAKRLGSFGKMKPPLRNKKDVEFLWKHLKAIDVIESDHAPHTIKEKGEDSPFGVPGLETTLPLLLTAVSENRLTIDDIVRLCHDNPSKIFRVRDSNDTYHRSTRIEVNLAKSYIIENKKLFTKCKWSPFNGARVKGKINRVFIRGKKVFENGKILVPTGWGKVIKPQR